MLETILSFFLNISLQWNLFTQIILLIVIIIGFPMVYNYMHKYYADKKPKTKTLQVIAFVVISIFLPIVAVATFAGIVSFTVFKFFTAFGKAVLKENGN